MANSFRHKRYFQYIEYDSTEGYVKEFTGTPEEAYNALSLPSVWNTGSPTKTYALADSNKSVVVTFEFGSEADSKRAGEIRAELKKLRN